MTALLSEMSILCVRGGCKILMVTYAFKSATQSHSDKLFFACTVYLDIKLENFNSHVDIQHIEQLLYHRRHSLCYSDLHQRSNWRATAQDTHQSFSDMTLCAYTASPYIHRYLIHNYAWQQNSRTCTLWVHTTYPTTVLLPTMHLFIRTKSASYTTHCSASSITMRYYRTSLRDRCQAANEEHKLWVKSFL